MRLIKSLVSWVVTTPIQPPCRERRKVRWAVLAASFGPFARLWADRTDAATPPSRFGIITGGIIALVAAVALPAGGQISDFEPRPASAPVLPDLAPPSPEVAMAAFAVVAARVAGQDAPWPPEVAALTTPAAVTLRLDGEIVGRGTAAIAEAGHFPLDVALRQALAEMDARVPPARDAVQDQRRRDRLAQAQISLELAGPMIPLTIERFDEADLAVAPGLEGVAARVGDQAAAAFPGGMFLAPTLPGDALMACLAQASGEPGFAFRGIKGREAGDLVRDRGAALFRFRVTHLATLAPRATPTFLFRGSRVVARSALTTPALRDFGDHLAANLRARVSPQGRLTATYHPVLARSDRDAVPVECFAAALALSMHAPRDTASAHAADAILTAALAQPLTSPVDAAAAIIAITQRQRVAPPPPDAIPAALPGLSATLQAALDETGAWKPVVPPSARGLACLALVRDVPADPASPRRAQASGAIRALYRETEGGRLITHLPWLLLAEQELAGDAPLPAATALRDVRTLLWRAQVQDDPAAPDFAGGFVFSGSAPYPTWHTVRPLAAAAAMLADPRLTDRPELLAETTRVLGGLRFMRQLTQDDASAWVVPAARGQWGVRAAPWDFRQPIDAQSLTLIAVCQSLDALEKVASRLSSGN